MDQTPRELTRRQFAIVGTQFVGAAVTVLLGVPIVGFLLSPLFESREIVWRRVGNVKDVPFGKPTKFVAPFPPESSWPIAQPNYAIYVVRYGPALGQVRVFSNICTHMQCPVRFDSSLGLFLCPCHGGLYDPLTGTNVGVPPPKPLPQWIHYIHPDGTLFVQNRLNESI